MQGNILMQELCYQGVTPEEAADALCLRADELLSRIFGEKEFCLEEIRRLKGLLALTDESRLSAMPKDLPVYFMSGDHDPVGQMGTGVRQVAEQFKKAGIKDITVKLYPDARHELFNELNRDEVTRELIAWLEKKTNSSE